MTGVAARLLSPRRGAELCRELLASAGIVVDGTRAWDITVHDERFYDRVLRDGTLGFGESYVEGWWDAPALDQTFDRLMLAHLGDAVADSWLVIAQSLRARLVNLQTIARSFDNGQRHYDIGNDLYAVMLGREMLYTCAYWHASTTLEQAQTAKLDLVCRKIGLAPGMRVLDLG